MSDIGTTSFDNSEKIDILIKENFNVSSTNENTPWYLENNVAFNTYINGKDVLLDEIPNSIDWTNYSFLSEQDLLSIYGLNNSDFYTGGGVKVDSTGILHKFIKLKLQPIPGTIVTSGTTTTYFSYYFKNSDGVNLLENSFQLNNGDGSSFEYALYSEDNIANNVSILQDSNGGNWFFNFKNGVVFVPDPINSLTMLNQVNQNKLPYFTFVKYVGRKGIIKQISIVQDKTTILNPENNQLVVQKSDDTIHRYDSSSGNWISVGGSGGGTTSILSLNDVNDVNVTTKNHGDVLKWDANNNNWIASADLQGSGGGNTTQPSRGILNSFTEAQVLEKVSTLVNGGNIINSSEQSKVLSSSVESVIPYYTNDTWYSINIFDIGIGITPPIGTKQVKLSYTAYLSFNNDNQIFDKDALLEWAWVIDNTVIINSKNIIHLDLVEKYATIETTVFIDENLVNDDIANNKLREWNSDKTILIYARSKDENQLIKFHKNKPTFEMTSIGQASTIVNLNDVPDVSFNKTELNNNDILKWNSINNKWENSNSFSYNNLTEKPYIPKFTNDITNNSGFVTQSHIDTSIANLVDSAPAALNTLNELAAALGDDENFSTTVNNELSKKLSITDASSTYATKNDVNSSLNLKQDTLTAGQNIVITNNTISAEIPVIETLNDISNVDVTTKNDGEVLKWNEEQQKWISDVVGTGNGVTVIPPSAEDTLKENINYPTANTGTGKEGDIIYDASENLFYEASNSKTDIIGNGDVQFRPLGYSFFAKNMEGQAPNVQSTSFFF